ncbi:hypothetical protein GCM10008957_25580 [Deinococcus ruber]|uniref:Uncharacterized protein n=2 Tax=Deinococcus ruber TaxID=1848197 RepID=A0A918C8S9_9DEIO|nr:hypothetical protein GCM10008957_25580 [Deinococcus ruber]
MPHAAPTLATQDTLHRHIPPFVLYHAADGCILHGLWAGWDVTEVAQTVIRQWSEAGHFGLARAQVRRPWWRLWRATDVLIIEVLEVDV